MRELVFLKLGGSLITDKTQAYAPRLDKLKSLAEEIRLGLTENPELTLLLGHGSGSFGHHAVQQHLDDVDFSRARSDASVRQRFWKGYAEVWYRASELNRYVMSALRVAGVPAVSLAPSAMVTAHDAQVRTWDLAELEAALDADLLPVIFGDIVFDDARGASVLSTEVLMTYLAERLRPSRILLAGLEEAVWEDFPGRTRRVVKITPGTLASIGGSLGGSHGADVTGGMRSKVEEMLQLIARAPGTRVQIFSGEKAGNVRAVLNGVNEGTLLAGD
jgi:isopentenyl phosphate kinase